MWTLFILTYFTLHLQVPQLNRRPEASWLLSSPVSLLLLFTRWLSATGLPPKGQHLQPPTHSFLSRVFAGAHTNSHPTGPDRSCQAQACTTLLRQHRHSTPEQVRRVCVCEFIQVCLQSSQVLLDFYSVEFNIMGSEITPIKIPIEIQYMHLLTKVFPGLNNNITTSHINHVQNKSA